MKGVVEAEQPVLGGRDYSSHTTYHTVTFMNITFTGEIFPNQKISNIWMNTRAWHPREFLRDERERFVPKICLGA
jgi:hypothetical protein